MVRRPAGRSVFAEGRATQREQSSMAKSAQPAVIRVSPLEGRSSPLMELFRALPAWIISAGIHGVLLVLFFLVLKPSDLGADDSKPNQQAETFNSKVEAPQKDMI